MNKRAAENAAAKRVSRETPDASLVSERTSAEKELWQVEMQKSSQGESPKPGTWWSRAYQEQHQDQSSADDAQSKVEPPPEKSEVGESVQAAASRRSVAKSASE